MFHAGAIMPMFIPMISQEENSDYAVEVALLSRNVIFEGKLGKAKLGKAAGYMQVLPTPGIVQSIQGGHVLI